MLDQPFAITLYAFLQLQERDRVRDLRRRYNAVQQGVLTAMAFNDPKSLDREQTTVLADMRAAPSSIARKDDAKSLRAAGLALAERIESTGVLRELEVEA